MEVESWNVIGGKGDAASALADGQKSIKYSKAEQVCPTWSAGCALCCLEAFTEHRMFSYCSSSFRFFTAL